MIRTVVTVIVAHAAAVFIAACQPVVSPSTSAETGQVPLVGTEWFLNEMQSQQLVHDEAVTALFNDDGTLEGVAACNSYTTRYETDGGELFIDPAIEAGANVCEQAAMALESIYLSSLQAAKSFEIDEEVLFMRDEDGTVTLVFDASGE